ncbi:MAG: flavodoxin family protein [Clostridiales bacterium]|nr:flavodoxin family protein [Clostridiales bacterium]
MKVLLVNGGPHREGCTYTALSEMATTFAKEGIETEIIWLGNKPIGGCICCRACRKTGKCAIDDGVNDFLDKAETADGFIFGSPVHWGAATGAITSFMDRLFYADLNGGGNRFYLKPAAAISSARRAGTTATWDQLNKYFGLMQMPIVTSQYWNMVHGAMADQVPSDAEGLQVMRTLARNMAFMLKCKQTALQNGVEMPERETGIFTNFVR